MVLIRLGFPDSNTDKENLNKLVSEMDPYFSEWIISMAIPVTNWWGSVARF